MKFELPKHDIISAIAAASHSMGKTDARYYINGMLFQIRDRVLYLVATDGARISVVQMDVPELGSGDAGDWIVSRESIGVLLGGVKSKKTDTLPLTLEFNELGGQIGPVGVLYVEGKFPEWQRVVQDKPVNAEFVGVDAALLAQAARSLKSIGGQGVRLSIRGTAGNESTWLEAKVRAEFRTIRKAYVKISGYRV